MKSNGILLVASLTFSLLTASCVSTKLIPLSANDRNAMKGKTVIATKRGMPAFTVITPGAAMAMGLGGAVGGAIAGGVASARGKDNFAESRIEIPEETISRQVMKNLVSKTGVRPSTATPQTVLSEKPEALAAQYQSADYVLDVRTTGWMSSYYPFALTSYYIGYSANMRLIDTKTQKVIAQGFQFYQGDDRKNAPNYSGIYSNNGAFLKAETKKGTDAATATFSQQF